MALEADFNRAQIRAPLRTVPAVLAGLVCWAWAVLFGVVSFFSTVGGGLAPGQGAGPAIFEIVVSAVVGAYAYAGFALFRRQLVGAWLAMVLGIVTVLVEVVRPLFAHSPATRVNLVLILVAAVSVWGRWRRTD